MRTLAILPMLAVSTQLLAQTPPPTPPGRLDPTRRETPSMPVRTLPIEVVTGAPSYFASYYYERAGLKPKEYRIGNDASMTGATWKPFTEGPTGTKTVNGRTVTTGYIEVPLAMGGSCANQSAWVEGYLQFRTRDLQGNVYTSNIKGQKVCMPLGG